MEYFTIQGDDFVTLDILYLQSQKLESEVIIMKKFVQEVIFSGVCFYHKTNAVGIVCYALNTAELNYRIDMVNRGEASFYAAFIKQDQDIRGCGDYPLTSAELKEKVIEAVQIIHEDVAARLIDHVKVVLRYGDDKYDIFWIDGEHDVVSEIQNKLEEEL